VLASGVTPAQLFLGKFAGLGGAALLLLAPLLGICLLALLFAGGGAWLPAAAVLLVVYGLYGALVLLLSLTVSARAATSQNALLVLLAFWAVVTFVVPRIAADLGRTLQPTPSAADLQRGIDADLASGLDGESPAAKVEKRRQQLLQLYKVQREQDLPINFQGIVFGIQDEVGNAVYDKHFGILERAIDRQVDVFEAASVLSPRMALALVSQEIAGTSLQQQRWFERGAERFRRGLMDILNRDIALNSRTGQADYRAGAELWRRTGEYRFEPEPLGTALARCAAPLTVLVLWLAILLGASVVTTRHLRVLAA
jgi:ABC-2 type transport system permease protein